jgi:hypothetical protein
VVRNFDFSSVVLWLDTLPVRHRGLLARNRELSLKIVPGMRPGYSYPPAGYLLDGWLETHWKNCSAFGNLYTIKSKDHRVHFILFCRLMGWFRLNDRAPWRDTKWKYVFDSGAQNNAFQRWQSGETLVVRGCGDNQNRGRYEARAFLSALDEVFGRTETREGVVEEWAGEMKRMEKAVERW